MPAAPVVAAAPPIQATSITPNAAPGTKFLVTGFVKLDALASSYGDGEIADGSIGRDFYVPSTIPVGGESEDIDLDAHVKQSRLIVGTDSTTEAGDKISSRLEFDLYGSALGDERATNTYGLQVRQAYVSYNQWLAGQTWSNFQDVNALPEAVDYIGPTDGTVFVRQPQVRYSAGGWTFSLENPETTITPYGGGARISSDDNSMPDATARYTWTRGWGYLSGALLGRQLKYETTAGADPFDDSAYALAATLSGKFLLPGGDDIRFAITGGQGIGRYVALNFANDAVLDADGALEAIDGIAGYAAWRHVFSPTPAREPDGLGLELRQRRRPHRRRGQRGLVRGRRQSLLDDPAQARPRHRIPPRAARDRERRRRHARPPAVHDQVLVLNRRRARLPARAGRLSGSGRRA